MSVSLDGELVLVTGGGQGLGAATSRVLASETGSNGDKHVQMQPPGTVIAEIMVIPTEETSWP